MRSLRKRQARCMARQAGREVSAVDGIGTMGEGLVGRRLAVFPFFPGFERRGGTSQQGGLTQLRGNHCHKIHPLTEAARVLRTYSSPVVCVNVQSLFCPHSLELYLLIVVNLLFTHHISPWSG